MHHGVEMAGVRLLAQQRLRPADFGQGAHAVGVAAHQRDLGARIRKCARRAARRPAVAHNQHRRFRQPQQPPQRQRYPRRVGIRSAPLARLAPHRVHRANAPRQRVHHVQVADDLLLVRQGDAETGQRQFGRHREEIAQVRRRHQERQVHRVHAARLEGPVVHRRRNGMADGVRNHAINLGRLPQFLHPVQMPQVPRAHLARRRPFGEHGRGIGVDPAEHRREHARGKTQLAHGQHNYVLFGQALGHGQYAHVVGRLARRGHHLVRVGRHFHDPAHHRIHGRRGFVVVIGNHHLRASAELAQPFRRNFGGFDFHVDGVGSAAHRQVQHGKLLFDAAVEPAVVLVAPAGGQQDAIRELFQKAANSRGAFSGVVQEIQAEFQKDLSRRGFAPRVVQKCWNVRQAQRDANPREQPRLRHGQRIIRIPQ